MNSTKGFLFDTIFLVYALMLTAGLILQPSEDFAEAHMTEIALGTLALTAFAALATFIARKTPITTCGAALFEGRQGRLWKPHLAIVFLLTLAASFLITDVSLSELADKEGAQGALRLFQGLAHANWSILPKALTQIVETIFVAFLATALAIPPAFILGFLGAKNIMTNRPAFAIYAITRTALNLVRSVEPLIWALTFTVWVGVGPFAGMLALMFHTVASLAKYYSEIVEDVNQGPVDGVRATGAGAIQTIWFAIVPQVLLPYISMTIYRWDTNVRMATVIGLVGGGGIGTLLIKYQGQAMWPEVGCIILVIAAAVWLMDLASAYIREGLR